MVKTKINNVFFSCVLIGNTAGNLPMLHIAHGIVFFEFQS